MSQGRECSDPQMCRKTPETINLENNQITLEYYSHCGMTVFCPFKLLHKILH